VFWSVLGKGKVEKNFTTSYPIRVCDGDYLFKGDHLYMQPLVSVCIPCFNQSQFAIDAITTSLLQTYQNVEVIFLDDASTDETPKYKNLTWYGEKEPKFKYYRSETPSGTGGSFNKAISYAKGEIIILLCADDYFLDRNVIQDIVDLFNHVPSLGHISRYYHQFIDGDKRPVRAWRGDDVMELANNPSGLAFRREAIYGKELTNRMFVEVSSLVSEVCLEWGYDILRYDTVAVRIHQSISRSKDYYLKRWTSSPVEEWSKVGGYALLKDYTSILQIKNYFTMEAVLKEVWNFIRLRPLNLINPAFIFFALLAILTPRRILRNIPDIYRKTWGRWTTREVKRKCQN